MDFSELERLTNKDIPDWRQEEIEKWCEFINLAQYKDIFAQHIPSGKELMQLNQHKIENILGITKPLHVRKLVKWIERILNNYRSFYDNNIRSTISYMILYPQQTSSKKYLKVAYELCESNLKIGSAKGCHVNLDSKDIKQRHAEIQFRDGKYLLQDLGSLSGTYVRIREIELTQGTIFMIGSQMVEVESLSTDRKLSMCELYYMRKSLLKNPFIQEKQKDADFDIVESPPKEDNGIESQSNDLTINFDNNYIPSEQVFTSFKVFNYLSFDQALARFELQFESTRQNHYTIGRKKTNSIPFVNDMEMSGNHAQIVFENNKIYLRDKQSKNGVWMRLSHPEKKSDFIVLQNGMSVRFGYYNDFKSFFGMMKEDNCQRGFSYNRVEKYCLRCYKKYHNTMLIPCSHQVYCKDCIKLHCDNQQKECPQCKNVYWDFVEILQ